MVEKKKIRKMAIFYPGPLGPFSGKVGDVVGYSCRNRHYLRAYLAKIKYPNTESQKKERDWFISMVRFASQATQALKLGFQLQAFNANMTEGNYFILRNKQHFHRDNGIVTVDYKQLRIATGPAADVYFKAPHFEPDETVTVEFEKNSMSLRASGDDKVYVYIYAPELSKGILSAPVVRKTKRLQMRLPESWAGLEVHLYGFVVDKDDRPSDSTYIGPGRVNHYEDRGRYIPLDNNWQEFVNLAQGTTPSPTPSTEEKMTEERPESTHYNSEPPGLP